jgi:hypothetical protein
MIARQGAAWCIAASGPSLSYPRSCADQIPGRDVVDADKPCSHIRCRFIRRGIAALLITLIEL